MSRRHLASAVVALLLAVAACSGSPEPPESSASDAPARATTTTAPPPPTLERVTVSPGVLGGEGDQQLLAVASGVAPVAGQRLVAVGVAGGRPAIWWSGDGRGWERASLPGELFGEATSVADVVADPLAGGWTVVGGDGGRAAAWASSDGETWERAEVDGGPAMATVASARTGMVAFSATGDDTVAWQSFSGRRWTRAFDDPAVFARPGSERVVGVVDAGFEVQAVVEREGTGPELWRSVDGLAWTVNPEVDGGLFPAAGSPTVMAAVALGGGAGAGSSTVVVGSDSKDDGADAALWLSAGPAGFEQVDHDESVFGGDGDQVMTAAAQDGDRLVAVGTETDSAGDLDAVVWSTATGSSLQRVDDGGLAVPGAQHIVDLAVLGRTPVAVGWEETAEGVDAAVWVVDQAPAEAEPPPAGPVLVWQRAPGQDALGGPGDQRMEGVVAPDDGFVAVGSVPGTDGDTDGAAWRSPDGMEWTLAAGGGSGLGGPGDQRLFDVAASGPGLIAVGVDGGSAAVWRSPDGSSWEREVADESVFGGPGDQRAQAIAGGGSASGWVAVGDSPSGAGDSEADAAVWRSPDGESWERVIDDALGGPGDQRLIDVAATASGFTAVGVDSGSAAAWTSADGRSWGRVDLGSGQAGPVVGDASSPALLAAGSTGGDGLDAVTWRSPDGKTWERVEGGELAGPLDQEVFGLAFGDGVLVAVGRANLGGGDDAAAWASADGASWARTPHDENVFGGDGAQRMADVAVRGSTAVAVGSSGSDAAAWVTDMSAGGARSRL